MYIPNGSVFDPAKAPSFKAFLTDFQPKLAKMVQECSKKTSVDGQAAYPFNKLDTKFKVPGIASVFTIGQDDGTAINDPSGNEIPK